MVRYIAVILITLPVAAVAQDNPAIERGSAADYRLRVRSQERAMEAQQRNADAAQAALFRGVKDAESFAKAANEARRQSVGNLYNRREELRAHKGSSREDRENIAVTNHQIERINDPTKPYLPDLSSGEILTLGDDRQLRVFSVVDKQNAIVETAERVVGRNDRQFWLTGIDTSGLADGEVVTLEGVLLRTGSKSYDATDDSVRTIPLMTRIELDETTMTRKGDVRTWTRKDGKTHTGALVIYDAGKATIQDMDGAKTVLRLVALSDDDRSYVDLHAPTPKRRTPR